MITLCSLYNYYIANLKIQNIDRNFVSQLLSCFDDQRIQLDYLLYLADNLG